MGACDLERDVVTVSIRDDQIRAARRKRDDVYYGPETRAMREDHRRQVQERDRSRQHIVTADKMSAGGVE